ncbi:uncharacterized protein LY79DRAFT_43047 [Colletotrichum navitas]|uniref:Uncharacterized protein n=1 Tax=Colletotrichum navitas TaxID=681940 RepID=A0AAD8UYR5_9PEZI|nr:uncharacterized protein LY79DRAFT_43047 [Colletotrichum navitas]KAK1572758.1 hypothetical protein LY79DRAFT_43047 [Colletotrichum navitas]
MLHLPEWRTWAVTYYPFVRHTSTHIRARARAHTHTHTHTHGFWRRPQNDTYAHTYYEDRAATSALTDSGHSPFPTTPPMRTDLPPTPTIIASLFLLASRRSLSSRAGKPSKQFLLVGSPRPRCQLGRDAPPEAVGTKGGGWVDSGKSIKTRQDKDSIRDSWDRRRKSVGNRRDPSYLPLFLPRPAYPSHPIPAILSQPSFSYSPFSSSVSPLFARRRVTKEAGKDDTLYKSCNGAFCLDHVPFHAALRARRLGISGHGIREGEICFLAGGMGDVSTFPGGGAQLRRPRIRTLSIIIILCKPGILPRSSLFFWPLRRGVVVCLRRGPVSGTVYDVRRNVPCGE